MDTHSGVDGPSRWMHKTGAGVSSRELDSQIQSDPTIRWPEQVSTSDTSPALIGGRVHVHVVNLLMPATDGWLNDIKSTD